MVVALALTIVKPVYAPKEHVLGAHVSELPPVPVDRVKLASHAEIWLAPVEQLYVAPAAAPEIGGQAVQDISPPSTTYCPLAPQLTLTGVDPAFTMPALQSFRLTAGGSVVSGGSAIYSDPTLVTRTSYLNTGMDLAEPNRAVFKMTGYDPAE